MHDQKQPTKPERLESLRRLSDDELVARLKSLAARERRATALLVAHLAELDTRDLRLRAGYPSLFVYCRDFLAVSEHEAYNRMEVARTARRFPLVLDLLASGAVNLTTVRLLGPHLTADNHSRVLESARGKRKAEVEEIVARVAPRPDVRLGRERSPLSKGREALARRASKGREGRARRASGGEADGLGARPWALRVRGGGRPPLRRARVRGVPPPAPLRGGRGGDGREHRAPTSRAQWLRGAALLPAARGSPLRSGTNRLRRSGAVQRGHTIDRDDADGVGKARRQARRGPAGGAPSAEAGEAAVARSLGK